MEYYLVNIEVFDVGEFRPVLVKGHRELVECVSTLNRNKYFIKDIKYLGNVVSFNELVQEEKPEDLNFGSLS